MAATTSDFFIQRLRAWGVTRIYGYPGDGINGLLGALQRAGKEAPEFVQARHEELAAFMACAHAKFTGEVGVCMATSGPGAIHLLNGLYDAASDHQPVVAIVGQAARTAMGGAYQQEVDLQSLFKDVAHEYVTTVMDPAAMRHSIDRAFRIAKAQRAVTCLIIPKDLQEEPAVAAPPHAHDTLHSSTDYCEPRVTPRAEDLRRAAEVLNAGKKVAILVGAGALQATEEVIEVAELLGAGVAKALLGRAALPDDLPFVTGAIGLLGTRPSWELMQECDTLLMVGSSFPYAEFLPKEGKARGVQIDRDGRMVGMRYPMEVCMVGDSADSLRALIPLLERKGDRSWRQQIEKSVREWNALMDKRAEEPANPLNPEKVFAELSKRLPERCIVACDTGTAAHWFSRNLKLRRGMMASASGNLATMGPGVPYVIAAKFAFPDRVPIALVGDGAMQMNGINGLITIAKYWRQWSDPRLIVLVINNRDLNMVTWEQRAMEGDPKFPASQELPDFPYARYAESIGLMGIKVDAPDQVGPAWDAALRADRPCVLEAYTDPDVPMLPPHITLAQAKKFTEAILKGDPGAAGVIKQTFREAVDAVLPKKK